jgi:dolichol-phosphate mannosyltransferase
MYSLVRIELSILTNFILNDLWTFRDRRKSKFFYRMIKSNLFFGIGVLISLCVLFLLTELFKVWYLLFNLIGIFVAFIWNFLTSIEIDMEKD